MRPFLLGLLLWAAALSAAPQELLSDNGHAFVGSSHALAFRSLDVPRLMEMESGAREHYLARAKQAGFTAISFEAPLFGPQGLIPQLGRGVRRPERFAQVFGSIFKQGLYAFPVLHTPPSARGMIGPDLLPVVFFGAPRAQAWGHWALAQLGKIKVGGKHLSAHPGVGGWILYRGPWPDSAPLKGRAPLSRPSAEDYMRQWALDQRVAARKLGYIQPIGLGLWPKDDLGSVSKREALDAAGPAPLAPLGNSATPSITVEQGLALDVLPPIPGTGGLEPSSPWDLEGLDWKAVESFFVAFAMRSQVDFFEMSLDTEDWHRVGQRLAQAVSKAEIPVIWRQDWRVASRYELPRRMEAPQPIAGLSGPWPESEWPENGSLLWDDEVPEALRAKPLKVLKHKVLKWGNDPVLALTLTHPSDYRVEYGPAWPLALTLSGTAASRYQQVALPGLEPGKPFLFRVLLESSLGQALYRTRWARSPR